MRYIAAFACLLSILFAQAQAGHSPSNVVEKSFAFPSPLQWKAQEVEISLIGLAWGPAQSPEMLAKGRERMAMDKPQFFPDRPFALALHFRATVPNVVAAEQYSSSGLTMVKNIDGDQEIPQQLTSSGFTPFSGSPIVPDLHFNRSRITEFWDMFPVSPEQKEFLFQVSDFGRLLRPGMASLSFRILLRDGEFTIVNTLPQPATGCSKLNQNLVGTIGANSRITVELKREGETISGTEKYIRVGQTLWLRGTADSMANFVVEERFPEEQVTGIFKGKFSPDCRSLTGYFSKPDGSRLQPFELHEAGSIDRPDSSSEQGQQ
jgi:hypothetical protein